MSKLERSFMYFRKMNFNKSNAVPTQTEIKLHLGDDLAKLLFGSTDPYVRELLGCHCTLVGPGEELWVSPSDLLIGCTKLKPPLTSKYIQALTHEGILEIGAEIEEKFKRIMDDRLKLALAANEEQLNYFFQKQLKKAIEDTKKEQQARHWAEIMLLNAEFELRLKSELEKLRDEMNSLKEIAVLQGKIEMKKLMQNKVEEVVNVTVSKLIEEYGIVLRQQSVKWHEHFNFHLKLAEERLEAAVANETLRCNEEFKSLYTELKCNFIANMMHITCTERRKAAMDKDTIYKNYDERIRHLEDTVRNVQNLLDEQVNVSLMKTKQIQSREEVLFKIIKEFQRFIYFVLRSEPKQAEYLLNIEKLMIFELTKTVMEKQPEVFEECSIYKAGQKEDSISSTSTKSDSLTIKDYHDIGNIEPTYSDNGTLSSSMDLPAFKFDEKIFIREDFRNMISQGLRITRSNHFWNWDIEDLQKHLTKKHGICLEDRPSADTLEPCHKSSFIVCDQQLPGHRSRFYHPCIGICEGTKPQRVKQKKSDDMISRSTYSFTCHCVDTKPVDETEKEEKISIKWEKESKYIPSEEAIVKPYDSTKNIGLSDSCVSCNILGEEAISRKKDGVCDCLPKMETPSLSHIEKLTKNLIEELEVFGEDTEVKCPIQEKQSSTRTPLHFTLDSNEKLRESLPSKRKTYETISDEYVLDESDSGDISKKISFPTKSKLALFARDSLTLSRPNLHPKKCDSNSVIPKSSMSSDEVFTDFLDKLTTTTTTVRRKSSGDRNVKISFVKQKKPGEDEHGVMFKSGTPKIIPNRLSSEDLMITEQKTTLGPHVDEKIKTFVKYISSDPHLMSLFKG